MSIKFKVRQKGDGFAIIDKIAEDLGFKTQGSTLDKEHRTIECLTHDDAQTLRKIYQEAGFKTQRINV